ncbi:DUF7882 family protein [Microbacterium jiangjiandongii]|uniref:DUF7882 family protein n=1 Tax=Microbacterium jiangjiandongii TaxID=3049071 RepID=UPI00214B557A|nr:ATP-dependent DNA ligase [Microbacterium sp. zg.Y843]MCR2817132.1 ATP-dependent DNA ligase [Microbacterium sp. zg.Y843]
MGKFTYNSHTSANFDDRLLAHLQVVMGAKLRRSEGFFFTWKDDTSLGSGRTSLWIHPGASLTFKFTGSRQPRINRAWIDALAATANSPRGLYAVPEPQGSESDAERVLLG